MSPLNGPSDRWKQWVIWLNPAVIDIPAFETFPLLCSLSIVLFRSLLSIISHSLLLLEDLALWGSEQTRARRYKFSG